MEMHHDGELCTERAKRYVLCEELLMLLRTAEASLRNNKTHVTAYQHELMRETLERALWLVTEEHKHN
jgi:hypothetical protein